MSQPKYNIGDRVRITEGPFKNQIVPVIGLSGITAQSTGESQILLLSMLDRNLWFLPSFVEPVTTSEIDGVNDWYVMAWYRVLKVPMDCSISEAEAAYKNLAFTEHPERGGNPEIMAKLNRAIEARRKRP